MCFYSTALGPGVKCAMLLQHRSAFARGLWCIARALTSASKGISPRTCAHAWAGKLEEATRAADAARELHESRVATLQALVEEVASSAVRCLMLIFALMRLCHLAGWGLPCLCTLVAGARRCQNLSFRFTRVTCRYLR